MRALAKATTVPGELTMIEVPTPEPGPGEVMIQVLAAGLCGTDLTLYQAPVQLAAQMGIEFPIVFGHEFAGRISALGAGVGGPALGTLVTANPHLFCKQCYYCRTDRPEVCVNRPIVGYNRPGGMAEYVVVRAENVYTLPDSVPPAVAALSEPLAVGTHMAARAGVRPGAVPVVLGPGPIGLATAIGCQVAGAERVIVAGLPEDADRLEVARRWGMETYYATDPALGEAVLAASDGLGAEIVFEVAGKAAALRQAFQLCRKDGTVFAVGIPADPVPVDVAMMALNEKRLVGSRGYRPVDWQAAASLVAQRTKDLEAMVSAVLPLDQAKLGFEKMIARQGLRQILDPTRVTQ